MLRAASALLALVLFACPLPCRAAEASFGGGPLPSAKRATLTLFDFESYDAVDSDRTIRTYNLNAGIGYYPLGRLAIYAIATATRSEGYSIDEFNPSLGRMNADSSGLGLSGLARFHVVRSQRLDLFVDASAGGVYYDRAFPPQGTRFNFMLRGGPGVTLFVRSDLRVELGYRYMRIANWKAPGDENPMIDSHGGFLGLNFGRAAGTPGHEAP